MPYVYEPVQTGEGQRPRSDFASLNSEVLTETFAQGFEENPVASLYRGAQLVSRLHNDSQRVDAATARQRIKERGMESELKVSDAGITEDGLQTLIERKQIELNRRDVFAQAEGGLVQGAERLGVGLGVGFIDPINIATAFIPVIGQERYAAMIAKAGGFLGRTAVRAGVGAVEGAVGQAIIEPLTYGARNLEQADYGMADSLLNVAFGGVFGAGLHSVGGAISDGVHVVRGTEPAWRPIEGLTPEQTTQVKALRTEIANGMDIRDIARATETFTPEMRAAVAPEPHVQSPAEIAHESLPPKVREDVLKQAIVQGLYGDPINVTPMIRAAETKEGSRAAAAVTHVVDEDTGAHTVSVPGGEVHAQESGRYLQVKRADVLESARGQRLGQAMIARLFDEAQARGLTLASDVTVSEDAARVYDALKRRGYTVVENPNTVNPATNGRVSAHPRVPVFEVTAKPRPTDAAPSAVPEFAPASRELKDAIAHAETVLARETDTGTPTADALKMATEEAALAQSDLKALTSRLGLEAEDAELRDVNEAAAHAERWAQAAELATVCLTRGG